MNPHEMISDFITGLPVPNVGAEMNRQEVERFLVEKKGFAKKDIQVDQKISLNIAEEIYLSKIDLVVSIERKNFMAIKCAAGSLGSREREILAAARLVDEYQIPYSVVSDGKTAIVLDTISGKKKGEGLDAIPSKQEAHMAIKHMNLAVFPENKKEREKLIFRSYDSMTVNIAR